MRNPIIVVSGLAILCVICTSCRRERELKKPESAQFGPGVDYTKIGDCHDNPISWTNEVDPGNGNKSGRVCSVSVEYLEKDGGPCNYNVGDSDDNFAPEPPASDIRLPLVIPSGDHIYFYSKAANRKLRLRRFVRTTADQGMSCDPNPFLHKLDDADDFDWQANTRAPKFGSPTNRTVDCEYKFELQVNIEDPKYPGDSRHGGKRFVCFDPHIILRSSGNNGGN